MFITSKWLADENLTKKLRDVDSMYGDRITKLHDLYGPKLREVKERFRMAVEDALFVLLEEYVLLDAKVRGEEKELLGERNEEIERQKMSAKTGQDVGGL